MLYTSILPILLAVAAHSAIAQIIFVPGQAQPLSAAPELIAVADFDMDGIDDVAVTDSTSGGLSVLLGTASGIFSLAVEVPIGGELRGIVAGDIDCDAIPDVAVVDDAGEGRVVVIPGHGNGTFKPPVVYRLGGRPSALAIGRFGRHGCPGVVVLDEEAGTLNLLPNRDSDRGSAVGQLPTGIRATRVATVDLNRDGLDDVISLGAGPTGAGTVSVFINIGDGNFEARHRFAVGLNPTDLAIADANADGGPDIVVLNASAASTQNGFSVSVLLNGEQSGDPRPEAAAFDPAVPVSVGCPSAVGGVPVRCTPRFIVAADFDFDGHVDLAISIATITSPANSAEPGGLVTVLRGNGDGTFDLASQIGVGADPQDLAVRDLNGDTWPDLLLAEQGNRALRILYSLQPEPWREPGCAGNWQCTLGFCIDGVCCESSCPPGEFCNIPGHVGRCAAAAENSSPCWSGEQCESGFCVDGSCCEARRCAVTERCDISGSEGVCTPPRVGAVPCLKPSDCGSSLCPPEEPRLCATAAPLATDTSELVPLTPTPSPTPTPSAFVAPPGAWVEVSAADGAPSDHVALAVTLHTGGHQLAGVQTDISFDRHAFVPGQVKGRPRCSVNPAINKPGTSFAFQPAGCVPGESCTAFRSLVLAVDNTDPIADGAVLFTCALQLTDDALPGTYPLTTALRIAADRNGNRIVLDAVDGAVTVTLAPGTTPKPTRTAAATSTASATPAPTFTPGPPVFVDVGSATGQPGDRVTVDVVLRTQGQTVAVLGNRLEVSPPLPLLNCQENPSLGKQATFVYRDPECRERMDCNAVTASVFALNNNAPIADGARLYTCTLLVAADAASGEYAILSSATTASDQFGAPLSSRSSAGKIDVVGGPTRTPTATPGKLSPGRDEIQVLIPPAETGPQTSIGRTSGDGASCAIATSGSTVSPHWLALGLFAILARVCAKRRSRDPGMVRNRL